MENAFFIIHFISVVHVLLPSDKDYIDYVSQIAMKIITYLRHVTMNRSVFDKRPDFH